MLALYALKAAVNLIAVDIIFGPHYCVVVVSPNVVLILLYTLSAQEQR